MLHVSSFHLYFSISYIFPSGCNYYYYYLDLPILIFLSCLRKIKDGILKRILLYHPRDRIHPEILYFPQLQRLYILMLLKLLSMWLNLL